jgi:signal transduction histidine kinase
MQTQHPRRPFWAGGGACSWVKGDTPAYVRLAHSELKRKNDALLDAISGMSHETKTPLALIYAYAAGLRDGVVDKSAAEIILSQVQRLNELVDKMIEVSRIDRKELCLSLFDLSELTRANLDAFDIMFRQKGIALTADIADGCLVEADKNKINTVLVNLISNAVKYTDNAWVDVAVAGSDDACTFTIKNGNTSLSRDVLNNLWEPFMSGKNPTMPNSPAQAWALLS